MIFHMSKTAIAGGVMMVLFLLVGLFGNVTINGEVVENRPKALLVAVIVFPLIILIMGFIFGFLKDALLAFFKEAKAKFSKKPTQAETPSSNTL